MIRAVRIGNQLFRVLAIVDERGRPLVMTMAASFVVAVNYPDWPRECFEEMKSCKAPIAPSRSAS